MENGKYAEVSSAARNLTALGLRVLIDGSTNSVPLEALSSKREILLNLEPMTQETMGKIGEYSEVIEILKKYDVFDIVWAVIGGVPADFTKLCWEMEHVEQKEVVTVVDSFLREKIGAAIAAVDRTIIKCPRMEAPLMMFMNVNEISLRYFRSKDIVLPSPCKILREKISGGVKVVLIPIDSA
jgi:hypothetical protein